MRPWPGHGDGPRAPASPPSGPPGIKPAAPRGEPPAREPPAARLGSQEPDTLTSHTLGRKAAAATATPAPAASRLVLPQAGPGRRPSAAAGSPREGGRRRRRHRARWRPGRAVVPAGRVNGPARTGAPRTGRRFAAAAAERI